MSPRRLPSLSAWPVLRQVREGDLYGLGEVAASPRTRELHARTRDADRVVRSICPYCAVGCGQRVYVKDERIVDIEGDDDSPISAGCLCPKGAASYQLVSGPQREREVLYRAPRAREWTRLPLERALDMVAERVKATRDETWEATSAEGNALNRTDGYAWSGRSYDHTGQLGASTWRHVTFLEQPRDDGAGAGLAWLMSSDVCKHCARAGCLEACPTGAIIRTGHGNVYVQPDVCNGCGYCVVACPFGVIDRLQDDGRAWKCTLCQDRLEDGLEPACAKACPTDSIQFGPLDELRRRAEERLVTVQARGQPQARLYGARAAEQPGTGGLNAFFLLADRPELYNLPPDPVVPTTRAPASWGAMAAAASGLLAVALGLAAWEA